MLTMSDDALEKALKATGYISQGTQPIEVNGKQIGNADVYYKDGVKIAIDATNGYRAIFTDTGDPYDYLSSNGPSFTKLGEYRNDTVTHRDWAVGVYRTDSGDCVVKATKGEIDVVTPGHMDQLHKLDNRCQTNSSMNANDAAIVVANDLAANYYSNIKGDAIHTVSTGNTSAYTSPTNGAITSDVSNGTIKSVCGSYRDTRGGATDDHGEYKTFNVFQNNGKTYLEIAWYPPKNMKDDSGNEVKLKNYRVILNQEINIFEQNGTVYFQSVDSDPSIAVYNVMGAFTNDGLTLVSGQITAELNNGQRESFPVGNLSLKKS